MKRSSRRRLLEMENGATAEQGYSSITTSDILLTLIAIVLLAATCYATCYYKKIHVKWMERQMNRRSLRKSKKGASRDDVANKPV